MKTLTILLTGIPEPKTVTVEAPIAESVVSAFLTQTPAQVPMEDGSTLYLNTRQVGGIAVADADPKPTPAQPADDVAQPEQPQEPAPDDRTVDELKAALDGASVEYPSTARKADLQELAKANGV